LKWQSQVTNPLGENTKVVINGNTLYVGGSGPNNYTSIQDAINDANDGDTVFVYNGTYREKIVIDKSIKLIGESKKKTIIETNEFPTIWVESEGITISNFFISNLNASAIYVDTWSENTTISNNIIFVEKPIHPAICLLSTHNLVFNNSIINGGILGGSYPNLVFNNTVNDLPLIYLQDAHDIFIRNKSGQIILVKCRNITITNQNIMNCYTSVGIYFSQRCNISKCNLSYSQYGLEIFDSLNVFIGKNILKGNVYGIYLEARKVKLEKNIVVGNFVRGIHIAHSRSVKIFENDIINNKVGLYLQDSKRCFISKNNFIDNQEHAEFDYIAAISVVGIYQTFTNLWLRNYWSNNSCPKIIFGEVMWCFFGAIAFTPWIQFDWMPSLKPIEWWKNG